MSANPCNHPNVQQFTELCLTCGHNIYESDAEYYKSELEQLKYQIRRQSKVCSHNRTDTFGGVVVCLDCGQDTY